MVDVRALVRRVHGAIGAISAQFAQALTSFVLAVAAARSLGAEGLGVYGLIYGGLVLAGAVTSGLVGDSLTVLDRQDERTRGGLEIVAVSSAVAAGLVGAALCRVTDIVTTTEAVAVGLALTTFIVEEQLRRLLMASLRFWRVLIVDVACLVVSVGWIAAAAVLDRISITNLFVAITLGQVVGILVATGLLPRVERRWARWRGADVAGVLRFGSWRAGQQAVRPGTLTVMRILVVAAVGMALFGELEAARVYTAPTLLMVNGVGAFLFASYATHRERPYGLRVRRADQAAVLLIVGVAAIGVVATVLTPVLGPLITDGGFTIHRVAVFSWMVYAAAVGMSMPYGGLASVTGMHVSVFNLRLLEASLSLGGVAVLLFVFHVSQDWVPCAMAVGTVVYGVITRQLFLVPRARQVEGRPVPAYPREDA